MGKYRSKLSHGSRRKFTAAFQERQGHTIDHD